MQGKRRGILVVVVMVAVVLVLAIGIIIGHFAVPKTQSYQQGAEDESISEKLIQEMKAENIESYLRDLTAHPHLAGTAADLSTAQNLSEFWKQQSFSRVSIVPYRVLLSYPDKENPNLVYLLDSNGQTLHRTQKMEKILRPEQNQSDVVPPFHAYSKPGSVTSEKLIYVNYGRVEDFIWLKENKSMNFNNTIVIARYGKIFRGDKVSNAENFGAKGILIYSDPADYAIDGETSVYPDSWWLPGTGVQRGTVYNGEGDPSTVGYPSLESSYRDISDRSEWPLPTISSHPIGYNDAIQFLGNMTGDVAPPEWQGKLSITYRLGPGFNNTSWKVQMNISTHDEYRTTYNVFGFIEGSVEPDRYVLIGNHRDAWVFGAADPSSGTAAMMEMSRAFGQMVKQGWRPRRTLIFCSWGAEEYGLIGSWEWVENFVKNLNQRAVAYLNVDIAVQGNYSMRASSTPSLHKIIYESSKKIPNPNPEEVKSDRPSLYDTWVNSFPRKGSQPKLPFINAVGAGSDFTGFLQLVGVSSMDTRYTYNTVSLLL
ncbi:N-acetylated-alpha-linked acidic dipeptidase 2-like [Lingula anatina]|uniref:N-acetylated-alpha-linked acidic dipeptidase 2-like n=1 Tax=Lingula anatina TaxID=7574 RepID=A0A2R2MR86_LINAN|nr:N-acetylated-alpha-linked acidic dipeptidase 2-like [Lingula anatina]|eukprot:XP_023932658.1 N-acetylated-alpha-linked acidic dipeptidase 2-like [Lingula anatina]